MFFQPHRFFEFQRQFPLQLRSSPGPHDADHACLRKLFCRTLFEPRQRYGQISAGIDQKKFRMKYDLQIQYPEAAAPAEGLFFVDQRSVQHGRNSFFRLDKHLFPINSEL